MISSPIFGDKTVLHLSVLFSVRGGVSNGGAVLSSLIQLTLHYIIYTILNFLHQFLVSYISPHCAREKTL